LPRPRGATIPPPQDAARPMVSSIIQTTPRRHVLIVEDELALAQALDHEIGHYHDVAIAHHAERTLELWGEKAFDAVLCDVRMPGMTGEALYDLVCERHPSQADAFIFMSGIGFVPEVERFSRRRADRSCTSLSHRRTRSSSSRRQVGRVSAK